MNTIDKALFALAAFAVLLGLTLAAYITYLAEQTNQEAIKAGLVEGFLPGSSSRVWVKP